MYEDEEQFGDEEVEIWDGFSSVRFTMDENLNTINEDNDNG